MKLSISHIEIDILVLFHYLRSTNRPISTLGSISEDIDFYFHHLDCFYLNFSPKATNAVAHRLIEFGLLSLFNHFWEDAYPNFIVDFLYENSLR